MTNAAVVASSRASVMQAVRSAVAGRTPGEPFTVQELLTEGSRAAVDQAMTRLARSGEVERVTRGVYAVPRVNATLGRRVPVSPEAAAEAIARSAGAVLSVHGAEAARRFGLTTQVPLTSVLTTTGRSRRVVVGGREVRLMHASSRRMALAGRPAGEALAALLYLGRSEVTTDVIAQVRRRLAPEEFEALREAVTAMPAWLTDLLHLAVPRELAIA